MKNKKRKPLVALTEPRISVTVPRRYTATLRRCAAALRLSAAALCVSVTALCLSLTACARSHGTANPHDTSSNINKTDNINKPLFEMYSDEKTVAFTHNFDIDNVVSLSYYRDNFETITTDDKAAIQAVYNGLAAVTVIGEYTDNIVAADAASSITFTLSDGSEVIFRFDFGHVCIGKKLYECDNKKALTSALINIDLDAQ